MEKRTLSLLACLFILLSCSSENTPPETQPENSVVFSEANSASTFLNITGIYYALTETLRDIPATDGLAINCDNSGTVTVSGNGDDSSGTYTFILTECDNSYSNPGIRFSGTVTYTFTTPNNTYIDNYSSDTITASDANSTFSLSDYAYSETVEMISLNSIDTVLQFTYSNTNGERYSVSLGSPIDWSSFSCPNGPVSGEILVEGANATQIRATIVSQTVEIEIFDGNTFSPLPGSPFPCSNFFR